MARTINTTKSNGDSSLNAMLASILLVMGLSLILMFIFTRRHQQEIEITTTASTAANEVSVPNTTALSHLTWEEERLARLQQDYANVNTQQANVEQMNSRIENLTTQAQALQQQIAENQIQLGQAYEVAAEQESQLVMDKNSAQMNFENRLQQIENEQVLLHRQASTTAPSSTTSTPAAPSTTPAGHNPDGTINAAVNATVNPVVNATLPTANPAPAAAPPTPSNQALISELEAQKSQVASAMRVNELETHNQIIATKQELQATRNTMLSSRDELKMDLKDTQQELQYWQSQKALSGNEKLRLERLASLQRQIDEQLSLVKKLRESR